MIENEEDLRKKINRNYLIRLCFPIEKRTQLVGFTRFCMIVGNMHAEHYSQKALKSHDYAPAYRGQKGRCEWFFIRGNKRYRKQTKCP